MKKISHLLILIFSTQFLFAQKQTAQFPGGIEALNNFIVENIIYPDYAMENNLEGKVVVNFIVDEVGKITDLKIKSSPKHDSIWQKSVTELFDKMPDWQPTIKNGVAVKTKFTLPLIYTIEKEEEPVEINLSSISTSGKNSSILSDEKIDKKTTQLPTRKTKLSEEEMLAKSPVVEKTTTNENVYAWADEAPNFPGGNYSFNNYLITNLKYPKDAIREGKQGTVLVSFVVNEDGSISDSRIEQSVFESIDEEAKRLVDNMPAWMPGKNKNTPVKVRAKVPINFLLK
jgi:TonB family protein